LASAVPASRLKAVIVDDEELARGYIRELLANHPEIEVAAECANGFEAVKAISETDPDLLFLDIQMPKLDGFEVLELLASGKPAKMPAVVFVTAYDEYAMRAFDAHAVDYLLKPFGAERFEKALDRAKSLVGAVGATLPADLPAAAHGAGRMERIVVRDGARIQVIPLDKLDYAEAQDDYVAFATGGKRYLKQQTIADLEGQLDQARFIRIHRSFLVNLERVARIEPYSKESRLAILADGTRLPVSRAGYARLLEAMEGSQGSRSTTR
jgi:two-component system LytT family response regulator